MTLRHVRGLVRRDENHHLTLTPPSLSHNSTHCFVYLHQLFFWFSLSFQISHQITWICVYIILSLCPRWRQMRGSIPRQTRLWTRGPRLPCVIFRISGKINSPQSSSLLFEGKLSWRQNSTNHNEVPKAKSIDRLHGKLTNLGWTSVFSFLQPPPGSLVFLRNRRHLCFAHTSPDMDYMASILGNINWSFLPEQRGAVCL